MHILSSDDIITVVIGMGADKFVSNFRFPYFLLSGLTYLHENSHKSASLNVTHHKY